ncbi:tRNA(adenine34) deaminase [Bacilli bacterium PM5-3]|nr:tRNA(adenine34) deaminase [Bacilli bacterium PM5-3]MDH6604164.1 tRNA(adenine34) deaminase [Bacilli bacterium PM5-9]
MSDIDYMKAALNQAYLAYEKDEVPVGAIIVCEDKIIARAHNTNHNDNNPLNHAEINVINQASKILNNKILDDCIMYVTLEPCMMCTGAIINARIKKVFFSTFDLKYGAILSNQFYKDSKEIDWTPGILKEESSKLLKKYFEEKRKEQ